MRLVPAHEQTDETDPARIRARRAAQLLARGELGQRLIEAAREGARGVSVGRDEPANTFSQWTAGLNEEARSWEPAA